MFTTDYVTHCLDLQSWPNRQRSAVAKMTDSQLANLYSSFWPSKSHLMELFLSILDHSAGQGLSEQEVLTKHQYSIYWARTLSFISQAWLTKNNMLLSWRNKALEEACRAGFLAGTKDLPRRFEFSFSFVIKDIVCWLHWFFPHSCVQFRSGSGSWKAHILVH